MSPTTMNNNTDLELGLKHDDPKPEMKENKGCILMVVMWVCTCMLGGAILVAGSSEEQSSGAPAFPWPSAS